MGRVEALQYHIYFLPSTKFFLILFFINLYKDYKTVDPKNVLLKLIKPPAQIVEFFIQKQDKPVT